jgi:hypothetical protein
MRCQRVAGARVHDAARDQRSQHHVVDHRSVVLGGESEFGGHAGELVAAAQHRDGLQLVDGVALADGEHRRVILCPRGAAGPFVSVEQAHRHHLPRLVDLSVSAAASVRPSRNATGARPGTPCRFERSGDARGMRRMTDRVLVGAHIALAGARSDSLDPLFTGATEGESAWRSTCRS